MPGPRRAHLVVLGLAACGGSAGPAPAPPAAPVVVATPRLTPDDVEVARVNGRPVWASCVAAQAAEVAGSADPRRAALDQCVAFELLAQAAEARGLAAAPEVASATRQAQVNRLIELDFEQRYRTPGDLAPQFDAVIKRNEWRMHLIELRASGFARFVVPEDAAPALEAKARALAEQLSGQLAGQTGLYSVHLKEAAQRLAGGSGVTVDAAEVKPMHQDDLVKPYAAALYAIPEVGRTSPAIRTPWGWDVVIWTGGIEAQERSRDEVVAELFPELRRRQFQLWVTQLVKQLGVRIELDEATVSRLDTGESPGGSR